MIGSQNLMSDVIVHKTAKQFLSCGGWVVTKSKKRRQSAEEKRKNEKGSLIFNRTHVYPTQEKKKIYLTYLASIARCAKGR
jgi:hypothetical protein